MEKISHYGKFINENDEPKFNKEKKLLKLFISPRLMKILSNMLKTGDYQVKTVANRIIGLTKNEEELFDISYLDIVDGKNDVISYMPSPRAWRSMEFVDQTIANKEPEKDCPMWTASGRQTTSPGKLITKLFDNFSDLAIEKFVNTYKAEISALFIFDNFRVIKGEEIRKWYSEKNYSPGGGGLNNSCMRYDACQLFFDIYVENPEKCGLLILTDFNNKLIGRALVWFGLRKPTDKTYMDRIYTIKQSDEELFKKYATGQGWIYKYQQSAHDPSYIENGQRIQKSVALSLKPKDYKKYPYMDTFKYYNTTTGRLGSDPGNPVENTKRIKLEGTDGSYGRVD